MTEKPPVWKNGILWVWSDYYKAYIANYAPSHYLQITTLHGDKND